MGLGNLLWADEGFGVRVRNGCMPITTGPRMWRLSMVDPRAELAGVCRKRQSSVDSRAIDYGLEPGTLRTYAGERIPLISARRK